MIISEQMDHTIMKYTVLIGLFAAFSIDVIGKSTGPLISQHEQIANASYITKCMAKLANMTGERVWDWIVDNDPKIQCIYWCQLTELGIINEGSIMRDKAIQYNEVTFSKYVNNTMIEKVVDWCIARASKKDNICARAGVFSRCSYYALLPYAPAAYRTRKSRILKPTNGTMPAEEDVMTSFI